MTPVRVAAIVAVLVCLGCGSDEPTVPLTHFVTRTYLLESVGGHAVPFYDSTNSPQVLVTDSGRVELDSTGTGTVTNWSRLRSGSDSTVDASFWVIQDYHISGDSIHFGPLTCRDFCFPERHGQVTDSTLTLTVSPVDAPNLIYRYRAIATP